MQIIASMGESAAGLTPVVGLQLSLDAENFTTGSTTWTDTVSNRVFTFRTGRATANPSTTWIPVKTVDGLNTYITFDSSQLQWAFTGPTLPNASLGSLSSFTTEGWWYITSGDSTSGNTAYALITERLGTNGGTSAINYGLGYGINTQTNLINAGFFKAGWQSTSGVPLNQVTAPVTNNTGVWMYITQTYDNTSHLLKMYWNGTLISQTTVSASQYNPITSNAGIVIGTRWDATNVNTSINFLNGRISIIRVWDSALSESAITTSFFSEKARFGITPITPPVTPVVNLDAAMFNTMPFNGAASAGTPLDPTGSNKLTVSNTFGTISWASNNGGVFVKTVQTNPQDSLVFGPDYSAGGQSYSIFIAYKPTGSGRLLNTNSEATGDWVMATLGDNMNGWYLGSSGYVSTGTAINNSWQMMWITYSLPENPQHGRIYVANNTTGGAVSLVANTTLTGAQTAFNQLRLFSRANGPGDACPAEVGVVQVFNSGLGTTEINSIFAAYRSRFGL
jgi:hypothetical protein